MNTNVMSYNLSHHDPGVLPLGQLVEDPQQVDAASHVPPEAD